MFEAALAGVVRRDRRDRSAEDSEGVDMVKYAVDELLHLVWLG